MSYGARLDPGWRTADDRLTSSAAVRAGHPGWGRGDGERRRRRCRRTYCPASLPPESGPAQSSDPGIWTAAVGSRTTAVQAGNYYFFFLPLLLFFLPFLPFLATPLTSLPDLPGQRNVDQTRQRIIDRRRLSTTLT